MDLLYFKYLGIYNYYLGKLPMWLPSVTIS